MRIAHIVFVQWSRGLRGARMPHPWKMLRLSRRGERRPLGLRALMGCP